jgi:Glucose / Sorbosone dehydrogenase/PQQ-like domain
VGSEVVLLELDNLSGATNHNGGAIHFGPDGRLYVAVGENANGANSQTLANLLGKMLRLDADGGIPADNPFFTTAAGKNRAIWALGLRNPFTFSFHRVSGRMFINDVGQNTWEEIDDGVAGSNYGWPTTEGVTSNPSFRSPLFVYPHTGGTTGGCAITGGAFYDSPIRPFPASYHDDYFFADFCNGWIRSFDPASGDVSVFATAINGPVDLRVQPDGSLYYLARGSGSVFRVQYTAGTLGARFLTVSSSDLRNVVQWINPSSAGYVSTELVVRTDRFPTGPGDGTVLQNGGTNGGRGRVVHSLPAGSNGQVFYYGAFVHRSAAPLVSPGSFAQGRPFDVAGPVKWAFATGIAGLTAPTVGGAGVIAASNDNVVYAMERGPDAPGGEWPAGFEPIELGGPVQDRSPVLPLDIAGANPVAMLGSQDGNVYAVDATQGSAAPLLWVTPIGPMVQAAPAGIFRGFGGSLDYVLASTRDGTGPNAFVALDPATGVELERFDNGGAGPGAIGIVNGMATVDYGPPPRVYFASHERTPVGSTITLWAFELKESPDPVFNMLWGRALGDVEGSPVARDGRLYVGSAQGGGTVYSIDAATGDESLDRTFVHGNGQVKGFVFPDRRSNDIYFATDDSVWGVTDTGAGSMTNRFGGPINLPGGATPSPVLFVPGSHFVYVGGSDGKLYEIDVLPATPVLKSVTLGDGQATVGAPSLDRVYNLVHVGTVAGVFYAVQVPLP